MTLRTQTATSWRGKITREPPGFASDPNRDSGRFRSGRGGIRHFSVRFQDPAGIERHPARWSACLPLPFWFRTGSGREPVLARGGAGGPVAVRFRSPPPSPLGAGQEEECWGARERLVRRQSRERLVCTLPSRPRPSWAIPQSEKHRRSRGTIECWTVGRGFFCWTLLGRAFSRLCCEGVRRRRGWRLLPWDWLGDGARRPAAGRGGCQCSSVSWRAGRRGVRGRCSGGSPSSC